MPNTSIRPLAPLLVIHGMNITRKNLNKWRNDIEQSLLLLQIPCPDLDQNRYIRSSLMGLPPPTIDDSREMMTMIKRIPTLCLFTLAASLAVPSGDVRADFAHLTLQSQPGDFIGQGKAFDITYNTPGSATISAQIRRSLVDGSPAELLFVVDQNNPATNTFALLFFGTDQLGIPFQAGTYGLPGNTAQRADFAQPGHAGLDVSFQNRGSNTLTGNFTVNSVSFFTDPSKSLQIGSLDVSFEQHSEGATPALFGRFTYQSSNAAVPEPSSLALAGAGLLGLALIGRRGQSAR